MCDVHRIGIRSTRSHVGDLALRSGRTYRNSIGAISHRVGAEGNRVLLLGAGAITHRHRVFTRGIGLGTDSHAVVATCGRSSTTRNCIRASSFRLRQLAGVVHLEHAVGAVADIGDAVVNIANTVVDIGHAATHFLELGNVHRIGIFLTSLHVGDLTLLAFASDRHGVVTISHRVGTQSNSVLGRSRRAAANGSALLLGSLGAIAHRQGTITLGLGVISEG
ncbi:hypothetical protein D9M70_433320 [compost metagenome]